LTVDIGVTAGKNQDYEFWMGLCGHLLRIERRGIADIGSFWVATSALSDHQRNEVSGLYLGPSNTAENRNAVLEDHLNGTADALWWFDDDTVPPDGALECLIDLNADIAAGVYYTKKVPSDPIAYLREADTGRYRPLRDYRCGEILEVDAVGMGCTLVRRSVYERIRQAYVLLERADTGTLIPIHKDDIVDLRDAARQMVSHPNQVLRTRHGIYRVQVLREPTAEVDRWPFYQMEYQRTEDLLFCEMAKRVGCTIMLDTAVECSHVGRKAYTGDEFRKMVRLALIREDEEPREDADASA
jgi:hypothetical protein